MTNELLIFSFDTVSKKKLSICKQANSEYLVYRYGTPETIEMQYPKRLDRTSWKAFTFSGMMRSGGKQNAGFGDYDLSFIVGNISYSVFQTWDDTEPTYSIGISIRKPVRGRETKILGLRDTQKGSLVLLDDEKERIENTSMQ